MHILEGLPRSVLTSYGPQLLFENQHAEDIYIWTDTQTLAISLLNIIFYKIWRKKKKSPKDPSLPSSWFTTSTADKIREFFRWFLVVYFCAWGTCTARGKQQLILLSVQWYLLTDLPDHRFSTVQFRVMDGKWFKRKPEAFLQACGLRKEQ